MRQEFRNFYNEMLKDIDRSMLLELPEREKVESCFWIAHNYWDKLKEFVRSRPFRDNNDEIDFFKNIKPRFTCYIEYMVLISQALACVPNEKNTAISFWRDEIDRFKRFQQRNVEFVVYYECKHKHQDSSYFLRKNNKAVSLVPAPAYDSDAEFCTSHDPLIRTFRAYKMYSKYARRKLWELTGRLKTS